MGDATTLLLDWTGLDWTGLDWTGLDWFRVVSVREQDEGTRPRVVDTLNPGFGWERREDHFMARKMYSEEFRRDALELYRQR